MKKATIHIEGMHCASCASLIEKSLLKMPNIKKVVVNVLAKKGFIEYESHLNPEEIKKAVNSTGYALVSVDYENESDKKMHEHHLHKAGLLKYDESHSTNHEHAHGGVTEEKEIKKWLRKTILSWSFTIPLVLLMLSERLFGIKLIQSDLTMSLVILALAFPVIFIFGFSTIKGGMRGLAHLIFNMDSLIVIGTIIAYSTGILSFFLPIQNYSGISAMIMAFFITGRYIETLARGRASQEIKKLLELGAKKARVIRNKKEIEIPISEVKLGDILLIKPGEKIPTDGIVIKGSSSVDESMVTGESLPIDKTIKSPVIGATINQDGVLYVKATKVGKDTFLAHIIKLVEEAQGTKIPIQELADKITAVFVPIVLLLSILTFAGWLLFTKDASTSLSVAISVLVIACPCAMGLATPTALMVGSGMGAKAGILIRKGEAIQTIKSVKIIAFDKTGTITKGSPELTDIKASVPEKYLLEVAGSLEKLSEHPIAKAIVARANLKKYREVKNFRILRGRGIEGTIGKKHFTIGNSLLMKENKIPLKEFERVVEQFESEGKTAMIVAEGSKAIGVLAVADTIKDDSREAIAKLRVSGYRTIMITGDNEKTARAIAKQAGIDEVLANVLPEDKAKAVENLQKEGMVAFVGDGINDAPALKQSNVGIAIGTGTDIAIEAGDIVLARGSLSSVVQAINLSKATFRKIRQNLFWAFFYNALAVPLAIAGFLSPVIAEIAMATSSVSVVVNANLLRRERI